MRRLFAARRQRSLYPIRSCHFCCIESWIVPPHPQSNKGDLDQETSPASSSTGPQISTGSVSNWFCSNCQCWNRADANQVGGIATWEQKMSNDALNVDSLEKRGAAGITSTSISSSSSRFPTSSPFCHSCQTNQMLILSILANGDTDEMDEGAVQEWQESLQARYPPVCHQCRDMVADRIDTADKMARRLIWNGWLRKSREKEKAAAASLSSPRKGVERQSKFENGPPSEVDTMRSWTGLLWVLQAIAFAHGFVLDLLAIWRSPDDDPIVQLVLFASPLASHSLALSWDPSFPRQLQLKRRLSPGSVLKFEGRERLQAVKYGLLGIRIFVLFLFSDLGFFSHLIGGKPYNLSGAKLFLAALSMMVQLGITFYAFVSLSVSEPHHISLKSRARSVDSPIKTNSSHHTSGKDSAFDLLSLDSTMKARAEQEQTLDKESSTLTKVEEMDWSPTPDVDVSRVGSDFQLGPQRFFEPVQKTGLEELLHSQLALGEGEPMTRGVKQESKVLNRAVAGCILATTTIAVTIAAIHLGPVEIGAALNHFAAQYIPGRIEQMRGRMSL